MGLTLGKSFNRSYGIRLPFLAGFYKIGVYYNKKSTFLLFDIEPDFSDEKINSNYGVKINMFKNLESSKFCETFLELHNFKKKTLDIINQFNNVKDLYHHNILFIMNESITLSKIEVLDRTLFDTLNLYGFTIENCQNEFIFLIAERQNVVKQLGKKVVRTTGLQIATSKSIKILDKSYQEYSDHKNTNIYNVVDHSNETINLT